MNRIGENLSKNVREYAIKTTNRNIPTRGIISNIFLGIGIFHAIYNEDSISQAFLSFIAPSAYIGYHSFKNYDKIKAEIQTFYR